MALFAEKRRNFSKGEFSLAPCLCLLSILSLTSFASFCLRFRSRFFKLRSSVVGGGGCVGVGGGSRPCPVACPGSRQPCTCPQLNFTWGCLPPSPPSEANSTALPFSAHSLSLGIPCWIYLSTVTCQLSCNALSLTLLHSLWDSLDCEFVILLLRLSSLVRCVFVLLPSSSSRGFNQPSSTAANYNCKERQRYSGRERKREWQRCWQFNFVSTTIEFMSCNSSAESAKSLVSKWIYDPTRTKCTARALSLG